MTVSQLYIGSIIEDLKTNSVYEIIGVGMEILNDREVFRYTVRILLNPLNIPTQEIKVADAWQLSTIHFYNVEPKTEPSLGYVSFPLATMYEEDSSKLANINIFVNNYFHHVRLFERNGSIYNVVLHDLTERTVKITKPANLFQSIFFNKAVVSKVIPITKLFEEFIVYIPD